jgi:hypothetical protein
MLNRAIVVCLLLRILPLLVGGAGATYKASIFRIVGFDPETEPTYFFIVPLLAYLAASLAGA